jgi:Raf kinase inhibitor-like YbhB/YbcL family protein
MKSFKNLIFLIFVSLLMMNGLIMVSQESAKKVEIHSTSFENGAFIPVKYTCDGDNISPELHWTNIPESTQSFVIICDDPDAPKGVWQHWSVYDIPIEITKLDEALPKTKVLSNGIKQGLTSFKTFGYGGPCPPQGVHRYYFKLYALDIKINELPGISKDTLLARMKNHVLDKAEIMGLYKRN